MNVDVGKVDDNGRAPGGRALFDKCGMRSPIFRATPWPATSCSPTTTAGSLPAARFRFWPLPRRPVTWVAVFSVPCQNEVLTKVFPGDPMASIELGAWCSSTRWRSTVELVRLQVLANARSIGHPRRGVLLRPHAADLYRRARGDAGHIGGIYQALGARFWGRAKPGSCGCSRTGPCSASGPCRRFVSARRAGIRGPPARRGGTPAPTEVNSVWLRIALASATRPLRHPGNFRYLFAVDRAVPTVYGPTLQYPKPHMLNSAVGHDQVVHHRRRTKSDAHNREHDDGAPNQQDGVRGAGSWHGLGTKLAANGTYRAW